MQSHAARIQAILERERLGHVSPGAPPRPALLALQQPPRRPLAGVGRAAQGMRAV